MSLAPTCRHQRDGHYLPLGLSCRPCRQACGRRRGPAAGAQRLALVPANARRAEAHAPAKACMQGSSTVPRGCVLKAHRLERRLAAEAAASRSAMPCSTLAAAWGCSDASSWNAPCRPVASTRDSLVVEQLAACASAAWPNSSAQRAFAQPSTPAYPTQPDELGVTGAEAAAIVGAARQGPHLHMGAPAGLTQEASECQQCSAQSKPCRH